MKFSARSEISASATVSVNDAALKKRAHGERVYNLAAGEPMIDTDSRIIEAAQRAMENGKTYYTPVAGIPELRDAAAHWINRMYYADYSAAQTLVTAGGKSAFHLIVQALIEPGDEVIIVAPYWVSYVSIVELYGGIPVIAQTNESDEWKLSADALEELCTDKTKMLIINNASNPTGMLYDRKEMSELVRTAAHNNVFTVSDEVYAGLVYDGREFVSAGSLREYADRIAVVQSASKQFAMTGWRVGLAFCPHELARRLVTLQGQDTTCASSISQWAALAAYECADEIVPNVAERMKSRRDEFIRRFNEIFTRPINPPKSALYCFIPLTAFGITHNDSVRFCLDALNRANVAMVPGAAFGKEGYIRCSFSEREEELAAAVSKLGDLYAG